MKYLTEMAFPVELTFEVLPAMLVEDTELPAQLDITRILLTITGPSGKPWLRNWCPANIQEPLSWITVPAARLPVCRAASAMKGL